MAANDMFRLVSLRRSFARRLNSVLCGKEKASARKGKTTQKR